jgi:hypothetical protein
MEFLICVLYYLVNFFIIHNVVIVIYLHIHCFPLHEPVLTYSVHNAMNRSGDPMNAIAHIQDNSTEFNISAATRIRTPDLRI